MFILLRFLTKLMKKVKNYIFTIKIKRTRLLKLYLAGVSQGEKLKIQRFFFFTLYNNIYFELLAHPREYID